MTSADQQKAEAIIGGWLWQPADGHNYRFEHALNTLTRYSETASMQPDEMKLVIEYLRTQTIGTDGISLMNRNVDLGTGWKAKDVWYQTVAGDQFANTESNRIRVYQVLVQMQGDASGEGPYTVEDGCRYSVEHTFYWDQESLPTLSESSSGVSYTMQGVTRDRETGLYSCVVEKRERVQQDVEEYKAAETLFETTETEQHIGVKEDDIDSTGSAASAAGGVLVTREITKNEDCTSNVTNVTKTERPVSDSTVVYKKTLFGTVESTTDRNQESPLNDGTGSDQTAMAFGETRRSEKTPGGRYDNTVEKTTASAAGTISETCEKSGGVVHTDSNVENVLTNPSAGAPHVGTGVEATVSPNTVEKRTIEKTDLGTFNVKTETTTFTETSAEATSKWATEEVTVTTTRHKVKPASGGVTIPADADGNAQYGEASAQPDDTGAISQTVSVVKPTAIDTDWITWDSTTTNPGGTYVYEHGVRIFKNQSQTWIRTNKPTKGSNAGIDIHINKLGLFDGSFNYTNLKSWTQPSGGTYGGIQNGTATGYEYKVTPTGKKMRRTVTMAVRTFYGRGNEGTEANSIANCYSHPAISLGSRTYGTAAPEYGTWQTV